MSLIKALSKENPTAIKPHLFTMFHISLLNRYLLKSLTSSSSHSRNLARGNEAAKSHRNIQKGLKMVTTNTLIKMKKIKSMKDTTGNEIGTEKKQKNLKKITNKTETTTLLLNKKLIEKLNYVLNSKG